MKLIKISTALVITTTIIIYSCNSNKKENILDSHSKDAVPSQTSAVPDADEYNNLTFSIEDTIKKTKSYFFSNSKSKDLFLLTINPGSIQNSKSELKIITGDIKIIYRQSFGTQYFLKGLEEPETIPINYQKNYDKYIEKYKKSLTLEQYKTYFNKTSDNFFDGIYLVKRDNYHELKDWAEDISDDEFLNEVLNDSTVYLLDIACFDCEEGGAMIGYSKKKNKVITLLEHD